MSDMRTVTDGESRRIVEIAVARGIPSENTVLLGRLRKKYATSLMRRGRDRQQCEVICCSSKGPHRCDKRAGWARVGGHPVCNRHAGDARHVAVFTEAEAIALHRQRCESDRMWLTETP